METVYKGQCLRGVCMQWGMCTEVVYAGVMYTGLVYTGVVYTRVVYTGGDKMERKISME